MSGGTFVTCPGCGRLMIGQRKGGAVYPQPHVCEETEARDLTCTILRHYGYTDDDIVYAEGIHPGRVCDEACETEAGSVHPGVYDELHRTAALVVEVIAPWIEARDGARLGPATP